ncbi:MLO-like protein 13 isoform X2 [Prosopis cineraria]|uniref:MLO-like protein 13 isoform X2 n=1 Tax=Prosopis cineraria TaxID=364024 RepID=UPI00241070B4|nr:MLO-like protein 13 isoform X2 [Prosopis cineraria]
MAEELNESLEYTPTWIVAVVCSIIVAISFLAERGIHHFGKYLEHKDNHALYRALEKLKEGVISRICIPPTLATNMLPCKRHHESTTGSEHDLIYYNTIINRRRLFSDETSSSSKHCTQKGKVPLLSLESLHHLHIFIFVLAVVHVVFCVTTMLLGGAKIRRWKKWEEDAREKTRRSGSGGNNSQALHQREFLKEHAEGFWRKATVVCWLRAFFKQFHGSVTESDYVALRHGFIKEHFPRDPAYDFHKYMMRELENDFKKVVGISWYLWLFVVLFLLLNLDGWHTYFWLAFLPLILLLLVGAKLEYIIARLAQEFGQKIEGEDQEAAKVVGVFNGKKEPRVKPSDKHFWFNSPALVLDLIHFILFQNSFEIAFFFWILFTYGFDSCIMEKVAFIVTRLVMGLIVQVLCSYSTLPLYALVTQMGSHYKFHDDVESNIFRWREGARSGVAGDSSAPGTSQSHKMVKEPTQHVQFDDRSQESSVELACIVEASSKEPYAVN